ncbi:ATP-dependent zinc metalloprotease FtsH [candidate division KSB3 bacterium]|uniref:ATP-dependent zinc metalloprotease FtsH n=1 Tax=candidate division KSB3 bacterium TaxID=2044937 RepID=A0A9D5JSI7_9BACT|nr:ATP-dependent zinc metalloprotease FtsH [candidate division KSB3 bacterium]MBD3323320.1 ATP-dependent zinc metalloprotease FtsH [candidate division KSB3 bacterium]
MANRQNDSNGVEKLKEWICKQLDIQPTNSKNKKKKKIPKRTHFTIWYVIIVFFILSIIQQLFLAGSIQDISYGEFKRKLTAGEVKYVNITPQLIRGVLKDGRSFVSIRVEDPDLVSQLDAQGVDYSGKYENRLIGAILSWVVPLAIFFLIWQWLFRRMGAGGAMMSFGRSKAKVFAEDETKVTFDDVAGIDEAKEELEEVVEFLRSPEKFQRLGGKIPKGVLLVGAPGTGKTLLARAVAGEAKVPFFSMSGSDFVEMFVGVGASRVRDLFKQAMDHAPCIVFIDELDALGKARGINPMGGHDEREQTLNQLLVEMDGFAPNTGVIIMAATNRPEILDPALLRPGRFDRQVAVDRPDVNGREAILRVHTKEVRLAEDVDLHVIAARTPGFVGADLANIINEAALLSARRGKESVGMAEFDEAIDRVIGGLEKKNRVISKKEKAIVAYHEAGHAIVAETVPTGDPVHKVSIIPRGIAALGYTQQLPTDDRYLMTRSELHDKICVLLGGRVAEEILFNDVSTGAQNDLQRATDIARSMVTEYGMSAKLGLRTFEKERRSAFMETPGYSPRDYSEEKAKQIDEEVEQLLELAHKRVTDILREKRQVLEELYQLLMKQEVVEGDQLRRVVGKSTEPPELPDGGQVPDVVPA